MEFIVLNLAKCDITMLSQEELASFINKSIALEYESTGDIEFCESFKDFSTFIKVGVQRKMKGNQYLLF